MSEHATVKLDGFVIPLIGIPAVATEGECGCCHEIFHLQQLEWNEEGRQLLCLRCRSSK